MTRPTAPPLPAGTAVPRVPSTVPAGLPDFPPSVYQQPFFDFIADPTAGSAVVIAVAGSGKTTTLLQALKLIPPDETVQFYAFNKAIADELFRRIPRSYRHVRASTFHSAGNRALLKWFGVNAFEPTNRKISQICRQELTFSERTRYESVIVKLVSLAKSSGIRTYVQADEPQAWQDLIDHHDLYLDDRTAKEEEAIRLARELLTRSIELAESDLLLDFDDQLYLPILWNLPIEQRRWVFVDEAQDTNAIRRELLAKSLEDGGRLVAVGDPGQAIYGFTGASHDAIELIKERWRCKEFPLSVCYRCPAKVIEQAQLIVPQIEAREDAPEGIVAELSVPELLQTFGPEDAVLCRNTAPLVDLAYNALGRGIGVQILGRDLGKGLIVLLDKMRADGIDELDTALRAYRDRECRKQRERGNDAKAEAIADRVDGLLAIIDHLPEKDRSLEALRATIDRLFGDEDERTADRGQVRRLTLSTVHKAKGREWPKVGILQPELLPAWWAKQPWQQQQEKNLQYVAYTRATEALYFLFD